MQHIKLGPLKIPYKVHTLNGEKRLSVFGLNIPFSSFTRNGKKYYRLFFLTLRLPFANKCLISHNKSHFLMGESLTEERIRDICVSIFEEKLGYTPDLDHPTTFNEKIFWMKLYYHDPLITTCCDKFAVKDYVNQRLGPGYTVPTLASWTSADDIDFDALPEQYVLKVNWSSGYNVIVKDAAALDRKHVREQVRHWMRPEQNSYYQAFNWGYKHMKPVVYAEEYLDQVDGQVYDYKFYCCNGKVRFLFIATDRHTDGKLTYDFFDTDFNHLPFTYGGRGHAMSVEKPVHFEEMIRCAELLAQPFPFVRVDFYETDDKIFVGEMTFYSGGGILPFDPPEWDRKLGEYIDLSEKRG